VGRWPAARRELRVPVKLVYVGLMPTTDGAPQTAAARRRSHPDEALRRLADADVLALAEDARVLAGVPGEEEAAAYRASLATLEVELTRRGMAVVAPVEPPVGAVLAHQSPERALARLAAAATEGDVDGFCEAVAYLPPVALREAFREANRFAREARVQALRAVAFHLDRGLFGREVAERRSTKLERRLRKVTNPVATLEDHIRWVLEYVQGTESAQ
jgi:phage FluMu protein gp41